MTKAAAPRTAGPPVRRRTLMAAAGSALALAPLAARAATTLHVTVAYYSAATGPYFRQMAKEFEAANPGITVSIDVVNWDTLLQTLQTDISGGVTPDLSIIGTRWLLTFVKDGVAEPLDHFMTPAFRSRFIGTFLEPAEMGGKVYGLPIAASARAMFYNRPMLAKAGFPDGPKTWDDVLAAARKIKAAGGYGFGLQGKEIETDVYWYYALWSYGGELIGPNGKAAFDSPAGIEALTLYQTMVKEGLTQPGVTDDNREDVQNLFKQGRVGMVITAPFLINQIATEAPHLQYGICPVPRGTTSATYAVTDSIVMFANSHAKEPAWKFLDFLFTKNPRVLFNKNEGFLPTTRAAAADPYFADNKRLQIFVSLLPEAHFAPTIPGWEGMAQAVIDAVQSVYLGQAQPAAALKLASAQADRALGGD